MKTLAMQTDSVGNEINVFTYQPNFLISSCPTRTDFTFPQIIVNIACIYHLLLHAFMLGKKCIA